MVDTTLNAGTGGIWTVTAPPGVTVSPTTDATGVTTALDITIDYSLASFTDPQLGSIVSTTFTGPVTDPKGTVAPGSFFPGLVVPTTIEVKNDLGVPINGYSFFAANADIATRSPLDIKGQDPHPDDYAHFHNLTPSSLIDVASGTPNATLSLFNPEFQPAGFGPATANVIAPDFISADGMIAPGAIEQLTGTGGHFTLHSEDTPGPDGGSFVLAFFPQATVGTPVAPTPTKSTIGLPSGETNLLPGQDQGDNLVFAGQNSDINSWSDLRFINPGDYSFDQLFVQGTTGNIHQSDGTRVTIAGGIQVNQSTLFYTDSPTNTQLSIGDSRIDNDGNFSFASSSGALPNVAFSGTVTVGSLGSNTLLLDGVNLTGGTIVQTGQFDVTALGGLAPDGSTNGSVSGTRLQIDAGVLNISFPAGFNGTIGPADPNAAALGGTVNIFNAQQVMAADFNTGSGLLTLLDGGGGDVGDLRFAGNASGLSLSLNGNVLAITDQGAAGNIPVQFV